MTFDEGVREHAGIPDDQVIMICVAMGWPDDGFPADTVVSSRKSVDEAAVFAGVEDQVQDPPPEGSIRTRARPVIMEALRGARLPARRSAAAPRTARSPR